MRKTICTLLVILIVVCVIILHTGTEGFAGCLIPVPSVVGTWVILYVIVAISAVLVFYLWNSSSLKRDGFLSTVKQVFTLKTGI
jgi:hypothetical protein